MQIQILAGDFRTVRGFTLIAAVVDEAAFFGLDEESKVKSDTELMRAIRPALATVGGKLIAISSPYAKKGWTFQTHKRNWANDNGKILVWNCPSRTMNPTLPQRIVDEALAEDRAAASAEYLGQFRDDVSDYLPRSAVEAVVMQGTTEQLPRTGITYAAFADLSGGRRDAAALAIAHREGETVVVDFLRQYKPPFDPNFVVHLMCEEARRFGISRVCGDNYAAEFVATAFERNRIRYRRSDKTRSELYIDLLPRICSKLIALPDDETLIDQLASLERRTRSGGRDVVDHPAGGHDDSANVVAGVVSVATTPQIRVGGLGGLTIAI